MSSAEGHLELLTEEQLVARCVQCFGKCMLIRWTSFTVVDVDDDEDVEDLEFADALFLSHQWLSDSLNLITQFVNFYQVGCRIYSNLTKNYITKSLQNNQVLCYSDILKNSCVLFYSNPCIPGISECRTARSSLSSCFVLDRKVSNALRCPTSSVCTSGPTQNNCGRREREHQKWSRCERSVGYNRTTHTQQYPIPDHPLPGSVPFPLGILSRNR